jgi:hypothetical protein
MTLCVTVNRRRSRVSRRNETRIGPRGPESIDYGTRRFPTKPTV